MALDNALIAPREAFVFAPGVTTFLIRDGSGAAERLIAESEPTQNGGESVLLRSAASVIGTLELDGESAELKLASDPDIVWRGKRRLFGYRRGRLSERISFRSEGGQSIRLLIGVENRDAVAAR